MDAYTMPISGDPVGGAVPGFGGESKGIVSRMLDAPKPLVKAAAKGYLFVGEKLAGLALSAGAPEKVGMAVHYWWGLAVLLLVVVLYGLASLIALPVRIVTYPMRLISGGEGFDPYGDAMLKKFNAKAGAYSSESFFAANEPFFAANEPFFAANEPFFAANEPFFQAPGPAEQKAALPEAPVINPAIECIGLSDAQCRALIAGQKREGMQGALIDPRLAEFASPDSGFAKGAESMIVNPRIDALMPAKMSNPRIDALLPPPAENYSPKPRAWKKRRFASSAYATQAARNEKYTNYVSSAQPAFGSVLLTGTRNQGDAAATGAEAEAYALKALGAI